MPAFTSHPTRRMPVGQSRPGLAFSLLPGGSLRGDREEEEEKEATLASASGNQLAPHPHPAEGRGGSGLPWLQGSVCSLLQVCPAARPCSAARGHTCAWRGPSLGGHSRTLRGTAQPTLAAGLAKPGGGGRQLQEQAVLALLGKRAKDSGLPAASSAPSPLGHLELRWSLGKSRAAPEVIATQEWPGGGGGHGHNSVGRGAQEGSERIHPFRWALFQAKRFVSGS